MFGVLLRGIGRKYGRLSWSRDDGMELGRVVFAFFEIVFLRLLYRRPRRSTRGEGLEDGGKVRGLVGLWKSHCHSIRARAEM